MIIEDKLTLVIKDRVNEHIIYLVDLYITIKNNKTRKKTSLILYNELYELYPGESQSIYQKYYIERKSKIKNTESIEINKVILKEEHGFTSYKR